MFFRSMTPAADGLPTVGRSARSLGVRVPQDIRADADGNVWPGQGGMSVAPDSMWNVPNHRRPRSMERGSTGPAFDQVFALVSIQVGLAVRLDPDRPTKHAYVEPASVVPLEAFEDSIADTRPEWKRVWP